MVHKCVFVIIIANFPVYFFHFVFLSDILHDLKRKKINKYWTCHFFNHYCEF